MPCFSASKIRFISAEQQSKDRARTSLSRQHSNAGFPPMQQAPLHKFNVSNKLRRECTSLMRARGKEFFLPPRDYVPVKPEFRHFHRAHTAVLQRQEVERLKNDAKYLTVEQRLDALMKKEEEEKRLAEEAERLRLYYKKLDDDRKNAELEAAKKNKKEDDEDLTGSGEKVKTLERAFLMKHEQEEEVKAVNRIILNAKCHAVRDAQIQERNEILKEQKEEENRLEKMVIDHATQALKQEDSDFEKQERQKAKYAKEIRQQLLEREALRFLETERIEEEARAMREANEALKRDMERDAREARERRERFRAELQRVTEMSNLFKKMLCEQEREAEMRVAAYMREKLEREKQLEKEKQRAKEAYEAKQKELYKLAQKMSESKSQREEMSYIHEQERVEREYRRKEMEAVRRKNQLKREMVEARERQLQETKTRQALQIAREERDFNQLIDNLKREEAKMKEKDEERERQRKCYRLDIIRQMSDKEHERRRNVEQERNQSNAWREAEKQRDVNVKAVIQAKLAAMRDACLPERYIKNVERELQKIIKKTSVPK